MRRQSYWYKIEPVCPFLKLGEEYWIDLNLINFVILMGVNLKILSFIFPFLMFRILNIGIFDALSNFEFQVLNYKQDTKFNKFFVL